MTPPLDLATVQAFAIACLVGALVGLEREKHRAVEHDDASPGLRTFIILAEIGAVAGDCLYASTAAVITPSPIARPWWRCSS